MERGQELLPSGKLAFAVCHLKNGCEVSSEDEAEELFGVLTRASCLQTCFHRQQKQLISDAN